MRALKPLFVLAVALSGAQASATQTVFLDFDTFTTGGKYVYTPIDRAFIAGKMDGTFGPYLDIDFSTTVPAGPHSTVFFNFGTGPYGGTADSVDILNVDGTDDAYVYAEGLLGALSSPAVPSAPPVTPADIVKASVNLATHELGHILGLRHHDSFGPPLSGIPISPGAYSPTFPGPVGAGATGSHVMSLSSSVGISRAKLVSDSLHFNFRSAFKLAASEQITPTPEVPGPKFTAATAQPIFFGVVSVPNSLPPGLNLEEFPTPGFDIRAVAVEGTIGPMVDGPIPMPPLASDYYRFTGSAGQIVTIEVMSTVLSADRAPDTSDVTVYLLDSMGLPVTHHGVGAFNDDDHESTDAILLDVVLPYTGTYYIEVGTSDPTVLFNSGAYVMYAYRYNVPEPTALAVFVGGGVLALRRRKATESGRTQ